MSGMPSAFRVHGALILVQVIFGGGSVVGKLGVESFNPMLFALIREVSAGILLLVGAVVVDGPRWPRARDSLLFISCGFFIFLNQVTIKPELSIAGQPTQCTSCALSWACFSW